MLVVVQAAAAAVWRWRTMPAVLTLVMVTSAEMMVIVAWSETSELY